MTLDKSQYDKGLSSAESSANSFASRLGNGIKTLGKGAAGAIGVAAKVGAKGAIATANAIKDITMQSFDAYAAQEQLVGGIETLFGESALDVIDKAKIAYRTAGFSMNDYMETAIQSAASLIKSLSGDQAEAARLMDLSIVDMSDNVNKMGTTMEAVQNAYRGFSRGNFTMLDNLALGFAGTKEGMQELLDKAKEISGVTYDIGSYSDIVKAIHVVQEEMGIAGTTSKEAADTISGSVGSLKAAWQNLVAGLASPDADLGVLFSDVLGSAAGVVKNTVPTITRILKTLGDNIGEWGKKLGDILLGTGDNLRISGIIDIIVNLANSIINAILSNLPEFEYAISTVIQQLLKSIDDNLDYDALERTIYSFIWRIPSSIEMILPSLLSVGSKLLFALIEGFARALPVIIPDIVRTIMEIAAFIADNIDIIIEAGSDLLAGLIDGLVKALPIIAEKLPYIIEAIVTELTKPETVSKLTTAAFKIITALAEGLITFIDVLLDTAPELIKNLVKAFKENWPQIKAAGYALLIKLAEAFISKLPELTNVGHKAISTLGKLLLSLASGFGEVGRAIVSGIIAGIHAKWSSLTSTMTSLAKSALSAAKSILGIHSPSTVFENQVGEPIAEGIELGFEKSMPLELKKMQNILLSSVPEFSAVNNVTNNGTIGRTGEIVLTIDGHELARFLAPSMDSQLAFGRA